VIGSPKITISGKSYDLTWTSHLLKVSDGGREVASLPLARLAPMLASQSLGQIVKRAVSRAA
jgi:hypothetical protein